MLHRRQLIETGLLSILAPPLLSAVARAADAPAVTLRAATFRGETQTLLQVAHLDKTPYRVSFAEFNAGNLIIEAMNADAIDVGGWSEIPLVFAAASKANIRVIAILKGDVNIQAVILPKDSPIQSIADLKGKRVGYVRATTSHYFLLKMLHEVGLSFDDIQPINLGPTDGRAAFASGGMDAWAIYGYAIPFAIAQNGARVLKTAKGILSGNYLVGVHPNVLENASMRTAAEDYVVRIGKAYQWRNTHKQEWAKILAPIINVPELVILGTLTNETQPYQLAAVDDAAILSAQDVANTFTQAKLIGPVDVRPFFDTSFNQAITAG